VTARLLARLGARELAGHPAQTLLAVCAIALGVALFLGIEITNQSARRSFAAATEAVTGRATHQVIGTSAPLPEDLFPRVAELPGLLAAPAVEGRITVGAGNRPLRLLGIDPFSERPFRPHLSALSNPGPRGRGGLELGAFLTRPYAAVLSSPTARTLAAVPGDPLEVTGPGGRVVTAPLVGVLEPADPVAAEALADLMVMDIASAQELLGEVGTLTRIDLVLAADGAAETLARLERILPPGARVLATAARSDATRAMSGAFLTHLRALSLLGLLCGMFLIYNTMTFAVVRRRGALGTLRALGMTGGQVLALVAGEAVLLGAAGTALGTGAGVVLARGLVRLATRTINDLYFALRVDAVALPPATLALGVALGLVATVASALPAALEAVRTPPRAVLLPSHLLSRARRALPRAVLTGVAGLGLGGALLAVPGGLAVAFAGLFAGLLGVAFLVPGATAGLMALLAPGAPRPLGRLAVRGVRASLSRTGVAVAALTVAVAVTVGVGVMIHSFRGTLERWLASTLVADLYLQPSRGDRLYDRGELPPELSGRLAALPGVARVSSARRLPLEGAPAGGALARFLLLAVDLDPRSYRGFTLLAGASEEVWPAFQTGAGVLVSEPFATRFGIGAGDRAVLPTDRGAIAVPVLAVYRDFAADQGVVVMARRRFAELYDDRGVSALSVFLDPGGDREAVEAAVRRAVEAVSPAVAVTPTGRLRHASLEVFDRTFRITAVLRLLSGAVAFLGVLSALLALELEKTRELSVLRALGLTPGQTFRLVSGETALLGITAGVLALPVGLALAAVMVFVINRRSFGWTLDLAVPGGVLLQAVALALAAAWLAGLYPALRLARTPPASGLREE
jgi:putative ABC transport system permease protein